MDPKDELREEPEEEIEEPEELVEEPEEELEPEEVQEEPVYEDYNSPYDQVRDNIRQNIKKRIQDRRNKTDENIKDRINKGRQQHQKQKSIRDAKKREEQIAKKLKDDAAKKAAKKTAEEGAKKVAGEGAKKAAGEAAKALANAVGTGLKAAAHAIGSAISSALGALVANPYFWIVVGVIAAVIAVVILVVVIFNTANFASEANCQTYYDVCHGGGQNVNAIQQACGNYDKYCKNSNVNNSKEAGSLMSLTHTKYTKDEFVAACNNQITDNTPKYKKDFYSKCGDIYTMAIDNNLNPEVIVARAYSEGFSPAHKYPEKNNYYGIGCYNGEDLSTCKSYSSFEEGVKGFFKIQSKYDTIEEMMGEYAYLGDYWYNPGGSGSGGCYYFESIKPYLSQNRINEIESAGICNNTDDKKCNKNGKGNCTPTSAEDREAYAKYQVIDTMVKNGNLIFGEVTPGGMIGLAKFPVRDTKPNWLSAPDSNYYTDTINGSNYFQCVWYAKARSVEILSSIEGADSSKVDEAITAVKNSGANGSGWYDLAQGDGSMSIFGSSNDVYSPRPGAMISWKWTESGCKAYKGAGKNCTEYGGSLTNYGHVGIIESVDYENQKVVVSDGWYNCGSWNSDRCFGFRSNEYSFDYLKSFGGNYIFLGYIYVADYVGG